MIMSFYMLFLIGFDNICLDIWFNAVSIFCELEVISVCIHSMVKDGASSTSKLNQHHKFKYRTRNIFGLRSWVGLE